MANLHLHAIALSLSLSLLLALANAGAIIPQQSEMVFPISDGWETLDDPFYEETRLLMKFEPETGVAYDSSENNLTSLISIPEGTPSLHSDVGGFGSAALFSQSEGDRLLISPTSALSLSNDSFTFEVWFRAFESPGWSSIFNMGANAGENGWWAMHFIDGKVMPAWGNQNFGQHGTDLDDSTWHYIVFQRTGSSLNLLLDFVPVNEWILEETRVFGNENFAYQIGAQVPQGRYFNGYIDELRITAAARYLIPVVPSLSPSLSPVSTPTASLSPLSTPTASISPSVTVTPLPSSGDFGTSPGTDPLFPSLSLLLRFELESTGPSSSLQDESPAALTGNIGYPASLPVIADSDVAFGSGCAVFAGANMFTISPTNHLSFSTLPFTVEMYVKPDDGNHWGALISVNPPSSQNGWFAVHMRNGLINPAWSNASQGFSTTNIADGEWHHIAFQRDSSHVVKTFIDTVEELSLTKSVSSSLSFGNANIAYNFAGQSGSGSRSLKGRLDNVRITKGAARY